LYIIFFGVTIYNNYKYYRTRFNASIGIIVWLCSYVYLPVSNNIITSDTILITKLSPWCIFKYLSDRLINYPSTTIFYELFDHLSWYVAFCGRNIHAHIIYVFNILYIIMHYCTEIITIIFTTAGSHTRFCHLLYLCSREIILKYSSISGQETL